MTRQDFFEIASEARRLTFAVKILTNGTLIDGETADRIVDLAPCSVDISIYGRPEAHDSITRVPGSQERSLGALRMLHERGQTVRIKSPIMRSNLYEYEYLRDLSKELGCGFVFDTSLAPADDGGTGPLAERLDREGLIDLYGRLLRGKRMEKGGNHDSPDVICNAGRNTARLTPSGDITACLAIREPVGNLRQRRLTELWGDVAFKKFRTMSPDQLPECVACELRDFCVRCPGFAECETGDLYGKSPGACLIAGVRRELHLKGADR
jgi:radical SAM protein with 4Fe4S-binding SPASM domain